MTTLQWIKQASISTGLYRPARYLYRNVINRGKLAQLRDEVAFFRGLLRPGCLCFDVGANIGEKSEALLMAGARVVAFEPLPDCFAELRARCDAHPGFTARRSALGAEPGEATLYVRGSRTASSLISDREVAGAVESAIEVPVTTLDAAVAEFGPPDYCKIDVEGWEPEVLKGLSQPIPLVSMEYVMLDEEIEKTRGCLRKLAALGPVSINITAAERLAFALPGWCPPGEFLSRFPDEFRGRDGFFYGDLFVKSL